MKRNGSPETCATNRASPSACVESVDVWPSGTPRDARIARRLLTSHAPSFNSVEASGVGVTSSSARSSATAEPHTLHTALLAVTIESASVEGRRKSECPSLRQLTCTSRRTRPAPASLATNDSCSGPRPAATNSAARPSTCASPKRCRKPRAAASSRISTPRARSGVTEACCGAASEGFSTLP